MARYENAISWLQAALNDKAVATELLMTPSQLESFESLINRACAEDQAAAENAGFDSFKQRSANPEYVFKNDYIAPLFKKYPEIKAPYNHQQLYLHAYKDQESSHAWKHALGRVIAVLAFFIPPLSLFSSYNLMKSNKKEGTTLSLRGKINMFLGAIIPGFSSHWSWKCHKITEARDKTIVKLTINSPSVFKETHQALKRLTDINSKEMSVPEKPKKVVIPTDNHRFDVYMDREQNNRHCLSLFGLFFNTETYHQSRLKSIELVKELESKYSKTPLFN